MTTMPPIIKFGRIREVRFEKVWQARLIGKPRTSLNIEIRRERLQARFPDGGLTEWEYVGLSDWMTASGDDAYELTAFMQVRSLA